MASGREMQVVKKGYSRWDKMRTEVMTGDFLVQKCVDVALFFKPPQNQKSADGSENAQKCDDVAQNQRLPRHLAHSGMVIFI